MHLIQDSNLKNVSTKFHYWLVLVYPLEFSAKSTHKLPQFFTEGSGRLSWRPSSTVTVNYSSRSLQSRVLFWVSPDPPPCTLLCWHMSCVIKINEPTTHREHFVSHHAWCYFISDTQMSVLAKKNNVVFTTPPAGILGLSSSFSWTVIIIFLCTMSRGTQW